MTNNDFSEISEGLERISRQGRQVEESPVVQSVRDLVGDINHRALNEAGIFNLSGMGFDDLAFSLEWEGEHTKMKEFKFGDTTFKVAPFHLSIEPTRIEGEDWLRFRVTANYTGEEDSITEIGITESLDPEQLRPILEAQVDAIRESARR